MIAACPSRVLILASGRVSDQRGRSHRSSARHARSVSVRSGMNRDAALSRLANVALESIGRIKAQLTEPSFSARPPSRPSSPFCPGTDTITAHHGEIVAQAMRGQLREIRPDLVRRHVPPSLVRRQMPNVLRIDHGLNSHDHAVHGTRPHGEPNQASVSDRITPRRCLMLSVSVISTPVPPRSAPP